MNSTDFVKSATGKVMLQGFMNEISRSNVKFVTTDCLEKVTWKNMLHQFMKEKTI